MSEKYNLCKIQQETLFDITVPAPMLIECRHCENQICSTEDGARLLGWHIFDGLSLGGTTMIDVVCPTCFGVRNRVIR